jgi:protein-S-isoprenylcysteine O-methyltransferase Ste14
MPDVYLAFLFGLGWIPLYVYRAESIQDALPYYTDAERRWVTLSPGIVGVHSTLACMLVSVSGSPPWRDGVGIAVFAIGVLFWFWARAQIGPLRVTRLPDQPPTRLRQDGAFGIVRNPLFLGYLLAAAAPLIVAPRPILFVTYAACATALIVRAVQEERRLHAQLGPAYAAYCRDVKRLIPFVW